MQVNDRQRRNAALADELGLAVREAGQIAMKYFRGAIKSWTKGHDSPVSEADIAVDEFLRARLSREGFGWLSEESQDDRARLSEERLFIVDPIDGTRSFLAGRPDWTVVAAVVEKSRPIAAAVYAPVDDDLYLAAAGKGASRNGKPITTTEGALLAGARVAGPKKVLERLAAIDPATIQEPKIHSLALRLTRVAEGRIDAAFASVNAYDWDLAAADLLVHEAGGAMTNLAGEALVYNLHDPVHGAILAAGRDRHAAMLDLVRSRRREFA
ncbi:3'(2'),5'-bisphosphate nucleotidase CysQ [Pseudorhodoplanes sp.]|uniref:3'(2'),5'-bisphosphate nucleotidase CysQ n=1 Tax=Pseudorhodoplanes sp. TaxID=1934341 RepID=UPI002B857983|nr:3'(2'),5'-bisphosphate nucleotidase CysQ [Pseudorhodoplanes sp.]HWV51894.1 3'(2'),5'-bisphosphate nucleotidase CysQ [Pseudorhodoplanes sp.]